LGDTVYIGRQAQAAWGGAVCINPMDTLPNGNFDLKFTEENAHELALADSLATSRNIAYWDGVPIAVSELRPALPLGQSRQVRAEGHLQVMPVHPSYPASQREGEKRVSRPRRAAFTAHWG